jgi:hypothetical protein
LRVGDYLVPMEINIHQLARIAPLLPGLHADQARRHGNEELLHLSTLQLFAPSLEFASHRTNPEYCWGNIAKRSGQSGPLRVLAYIDDHLPLAITSPAVAQRIPGLRKREALFNLDGILPFICHLCQPLQQFSV